MNLFKSLLHCSSLCSLVIFSAVCVSPAYAFDPNEGADAPQVSAPAALPNARLLLNSGTGTSRRQSVAFPQIVNVGAGATVQPIQFNPTNTPPLVQTAPAIAFPPVDAATLQKAQVELGKNPAPAVVNTVPQAPLATGFIAPAPLIATAPITPPQDSTKPVAIVVPQTPAAQPFADAPVASTVAVAPEGLSTKSKTILSTIPSRLDTPVPAKSANVKVSRVNPKVDLDKPAGGVDAYESQGIKMSVRRPGIDTNAELTKAYNDISAGEAGSAIEAYKRVLAADPLNQDALFGLASIYHRQGQIDKARPLYGILLKNYPDHRDGLNNFLVLISDEAPEEALAELNRLEQRNPDFSPIPAQEALLLNKMGYVVEAREKMIRAIELAPDNLTYKYNLAVMLDSQGDYASAATVYGDLIKAATNGGVLPISLDALQRRMNFISQQNQAQNNTPR